jgi:hypothetical protein
MAYMIDTPNRRADSLMIDTPADVGRCGDSAVIDSPADVGWDNIPAEDS